MLEIFLVHVHTGDTTVLYVESRAAHDDLVALLEASNDFGVLSHAKPLISL